MGTKRTVVIGKRCDSAADSRSGQPRQFLVAEFTGARDDVPFEVVVTLGYLVEAGSLLVATVEQREVNEEVSRGVKNRHAGDEGEQ